MGGLTGIREVSRIPPGQEIIWLRLVLTARQQTVLGPHNGPNFLVLQKADRMNIQLHHLRTMHAVHSSAHSWLEEAVDGA